MYRLLALTLALVACNTPPAQGGDQSDAEVATASSAPASAEGMADPVARVSGEPITLAELDASAKAELLKIDQQLFDIRKNALNQMIDLSLAEKEAVARSITTEALLKAEVEDKVAPIGDTEVEAFFKENQGRMRGDLTQMADPIKKHLAQQQAVALMDAFTKSLRDKANVEIYLQQPRVKVDPGDSPRHGNVSAPVEIIEFSDFQCPYCIRGADTLDEVKEKYGDKVTIVFRHFPLPMHDRAHRAAEASECANEQGKFWEYHDTLFANQRAMTEDDLSGYAQTAGLDLTKFGECLSSGRHVATVEQDMKEGAEAGMSGTPGFFINGVFLGGAMPIEKFSEVIDAELQLNAG
jgi:protein-disulfide isomerase